MTMDFELIEKYAIFVSLCDSLHVMDLVQNDQRFIRTRMLTSPKPASGKITVNPLNFNMKRNPSQKGRNSSFRGKRKSKEKRRDEFLQRPTLSIQTFPSSAEPTIQMVGFQIEQFTVKEKNIQSPRFSDVARSPK